MLFFMRFSFMSGMAFRIATSKKLWKKDRRAILPHEILGTPVAKGRGEVARTQDVWGAEGISGRVKFLLLAWAGMPKTSFRKNSDSPLLCES
jgi:hypothetical protein